VVAAAVGLVGMAVARAADHPDSMTQPVADGCNRSQLALLAEGGVGLTDVAHPTMFPSWVYVDGDNSPKTLEGTVLGTHTAGTDLFGVHDTYDVNIDVSVAPGYEHLLSTRNAAESPPQIHTEWESGLVPMWAWPSAGDRVRETGSFIWDCGHWQGGSRNYPNSDFLPGDPAAALGQEQIGGEAAEIHPVQELATWRRQSPLSFGQPVSQLDVYLSNQGGKAKAVMECALTSQAHPDAAPQRIAAGEGCSQLQPLAGRDYTYRLDGPGPRPSQDAVLSAEVIDRGRHNAPEAEAVVVDDHVQVTVPFSQVPASSTLQDLGITVRAWWSTDARPTRAFKVTVERLQVFNNLDGDIGEDKSDPSVDAPGEWNMFLDTAGSWVNVHEAVPGLRKVPNAAGSAAGSELDVSGLAPQAVGVPADGSLRLFVDARECDLPGYKDCPADELDFGQFPGRSEIVVPVSSLSGGSTTVVLHPPVCVVDFACPEEMSKPSQCPVGCWQMAFKIEDVTVAGAALAQHRIEGDGTPAGTTVDGVRRAAVLPPITRYGLDQGEENDRVAAIVRELRSRR
jgi:hypothetical protein